MVDTQIISRFRIIKARIAFLSFALGITSIFMGCAQMVGDFYLSTMNTPISFISPLAALIGLIFGIIGLKSGRKGLAKMGIVLCVIGLFCTFVFVPL